MKVYREQSLRDFAFWSGAKDTAKYLTAEQMDTVETMLEDLYPDGMSETEINDIFWFEEDTIADWLGYDSFNEIMEEADSEDEAE